MGRPSDFAQDTADRICARLVEGESLRAICRDDDMPDASTVFRWMNAHPEFREQYAYARELQADLAFDDIVEIADDGRNDWMERHDGSVALNKEAIQRSALRVDTRKWRMSKLLPKKYGDKLAVDHSGTVAVETGPDLSKLSKDERGALKALLLVAEERKGAVQDSTADGDGEVA